MKRTRWGEFKDGSSKRKQLKPGEFILPSQKAEKLKKLKEFAKNAEKKIVKIKLKNPLLTQTVEVMNQNEMLQALIDTYANKSGFNNYLSIIPQVNFPPENTADFVNESNYAKPFWFIPPTESDFTRGSPKSFPIINKEICKLVFRKSICGLLRIAGFNEASHSSLVMFTDAVEEFIRNLLTQTKDVQINESNEKQTLDILTLEKGYFHLTNCSLASLHNYFKNNIIGRNRSEIEEFKEAFQEYDKMMKESQNMQKMSFKEEEYMNYLDFSGSITTTTAQQPEVTNVNIMNYVETTQDNSSGNADNYKDVFHGEVIKTERTPESQQICFSTGPSSLE